MVMPWRIETVGIKVTKHFMLKYMRRWNWDFIDLRDAIRNSYKVEKIGREKFEIYVEKKGFKKIITVYYGGIDELVCITGSEGGGRK
ncbi:MAG TPA: hypothetical protein VI612_04625 [Candidatus Nanoarchaeia archaeon]|nr:hypothetical protein [Candidatus Nanoarchaeia archaeon]